MKRILVTVPLEQKHRELLESAAHGCELLFRSDGRPLDPRLPLRPLDAPQYTQEEIDSADAILGNVPVSMIKASPRLEWLQTSSAGVEQYVAPGALAPSTKLTNATGTYGLAISEYMLAVLMGLMKKLELYRDAQKSGLWASQGKVDSICGATVLVLGMGDIGGEFGARCKALGARVIGVRRTNAAKPDYADEVHLTADLDKLLPEADVVAITLPGTEATRSMISRERIALMKDGAYLLNVGRGFIVDTEAMCDALISGKLAGAGVDVTDPEPLPPEHRLWRIPNAVVTPHTSGYFHLKETHERMVRIFAENLESYAAGRPLRNVVDFATGYRRI